MEQLFPILGLVLMAVALLQFALWTGRGLHLRRLEKKKFDVELEKLHAEIYQITQGENPVATTTVAQVATQTDSANSEPQNAMVATPAVHPEATPQPVLQPGDWKGYRTFRVAKLVPETQVCTSVFLMPLDGQAIVPFHPGQHLTLKFPVPGQPKPAVRCYTLSDAPNDAYYRISVKRALPPPGKPEIPPGLVSNFVNGQLKEGDTIDIKSPSGSFYLQPGNDPIVLLAGGIGITPMLSMMNHIAQTNSQRDCLLMYGVRNSSDHAFKNHFAALAAKFPNLHVVNCYSHPEPNDQPQVDFQVGGFVSVDVLKQILPSNDFDFYLCGPPPFMQSLYDGLSAWDVPDSRIRYEAFGPASLKKKTQARPTEPVQTPHSVGLVQSHQQETWEGNHDNLLEFMEAKGISIDSGCRAGSCGTCQTRLLKGQVAYDDPAAVECDPGHCLPCIAKPTEAIELDA